MYYIAGLTFIGLVQRQRYHRERELAAGAMAGAATKAGSAEEIQRFGISSNGRFSESISYSGVVYTSGQVGKGRNIQEATRLALEDVEHALTLAGTNKTRLLSVTIYLKNIDRDYSGMNEVYDQWISPGLPPCRATVQSNLAVSLLHCAALLCSALLCSALRCCDWLTGWLAGWLAGWLTD